MSWGLSELAAARALAMMVRSVESCALKAGSGGGGGKGNMIGGGGGRGKACWAVPQGFPMQTLKHMGGPACVGGGCAVRPMGAIAGATMGCAVTGGMV